MSNTMAVLFVDYITTLQEIKHTKVVIEIIRTSGQTSSNWVGFYTY